MIADAHPTLPEFDYLRPVSLEEASQFLVQYTGDARPFLGGTDIFVRMRDGFLNPRYLLDVKHLEGMQELSFDAKKGLKIGAGVSMNRIIASLEVQENYPLLIESCRSVASYQLRNRATVAGNICNASPAGDTIGTCLLFNAVVHIHGVSGPRQEKLDSFFLAPGKTTLQPGDLVTAIHLPLPPKGAAGRYLKLGRNKLGDLALVGVSVLGYPDADVRAGYRFRIALASVAPIPLLLPQVEDFLAERPTNGALLEEAARLAAEACTPIDDVRGTARYRRQMVRNLTRQGLNEVWEKLSSA